MLQRRLEVLLSRRSHLAQRLFLFYWSVLLVCVQLRLHRSHPHCCNHFCQQSESCYSVFFFLEGPHLVSTNCVLFSQTTGWDVSLTFKSSSTRESWDRWWVSAQSLRKVHIQVPIFHQWAQTPERDSSVHTSMEFAAVWRECKWTPWRYVLTQCVSDNIFSPDVFCLRRLMSFMTRTTSPCLQASRINAGPSVIFSARMSE